MPDRLPAPLTPPDCDLRAFRDMPLDVQRLRDSDLMLESPEAIVAAVHLWMAAWHQVPAASLPDDDRSLARYAGYGRSIAAWHEVRSAAMRGFVRCSDGRLYHRTLAEKAQSAWRKRLEHEWSRARDRHRKQYPKPETRPPFPEFDDWLAGRPAPERAPDRQGDLPLESPAVSDGSDLRARAPASKARAHTGARSVPDALSIGNDDQFQRKGDLIPMESGLKRREGKGSKESTQPNPVEAETPVVGSGDDQPSGEPPPGRLANADLKTKFDEVCDAAGFIPQTPTRIDSSLKVVEEWVERKLDFDLVVLPAIRNVVANSTEPVRGLWKFRDSVNHEAAKLKATAAKGRSYHAPVSPVVERPDEPPVMAQIRTQLLDRLGAQTYCMAFNEVRLVDNREEGDARLPLYVEGSDYLRDKAVFGQFASVLRNAAQAHGFKEIW